MLPIPGFEVGKNGWDPGIWDSGIADTSGYSVNAWWCLMCGCSSSAGEASQSSCDVSQSQAELQTHRNTMSVVSAIFTAATQLLQHALPCHGLSSCNICTPSQNYW